MIRNIIFIFIVTIIISSCGGYEPIYSEKDFNFKLGKILTSGNKELNKTLIRNIRILKKKM